LKGYGIKGMTETNWTKGPRKRLKEGASGGGEEEEASGDDVYLDRDWKGRLF
jgi:hypothetical protein